MKVRLTDKWIYIIAVINALIWIAVWGVYHTFDSDSYIEAWDNSWSKGIMDEFRTPVYPVFIGIMKTIFGSYFKIACVIVQYIVFLVSIHYFNKTISWKVCSQTVVKWATLFYAIIPAMIIWNNSIQTESFAISGTVFLFYNLFAFQQTPKLKYPIWVTFWMLFLIMLRPSFLYLIPATAIAWLLFYKYSKLLSLYGLIGVIVVSLLEFGYCSKFKEKYGIFSPSVVSVINQLHIALNDGLLDSTYTTNTEYQYFISQNNGKSIDDSYFTYPIIQKYGINTVQKSIAISQKCKPKEWILNTYLRYRFASKTPIIAATTWISILSEFIGFSILDVHLFLLIYVIFLIYMATKYRRLFVSSMIMWVTVIGNILLVAIGAYSDYSRLLLPSLPLLIIMFCQITNHIRSVISPNIVKSTDY